MTTAMVIARERRLMAQVERWMGAHVVGIIMVGVVVIAALIAAPFVLPRTGTSTDWFDLTAILAIVGGFALAMRIPGRSERALAQLADRRVLPFSAGEHLDRVERDLLARAARAARWGSLVGGVVFLLPIAIILISSVPPLLADVRTHNAFDLAFSTGGLVIDVFATLLVGLLGGYYCGYAISVGRWATLLQAQGVALRVRPGHPDGAAGWAPLGDLYFYHALMLTIPALYYGVWSYLIAANIAHTYASYHSVQTPYFVFFLVSLAIEVLAFIAPVWSFHEDMRRQKAKLASETDALSDRILTMQERAVATDDLEEVPKFSQQLAAMTSLYTARVGMPTWPFNTRVTVRFVLANVGLLLPLIAQLAQFHFQH